MPSDQKRDNDTDWEQTFDDEVKEPHRHSMSDLVDKSKEHGEERINNTKPKHRY
jgi:hypothetical protein